MECLRHLLKLAYYLQYIETCTKLLSKMCICTTDLVFVKFLVLEMIYYHVHNTVRLFDGWTDFPFITCKRKRDY